ncbi:SpoIID/LytB domain-containing protein [Demequina aurantiaca]|uniref:SpoIID/LytB domain-containing protein n=1 Tax=Demequina aurantiaca TaxID=676200 RepID=UPI0007847A65|nr:SpoIID/LytB domain-containing protein [Demequina aurantiaca]
MAPRSYRRRWSALAAALIAVLVSVPLTTTATAAPKSFPDVPATHQFFTQITWLAAEGITTGYADGTFRPKDSVSREAFVAFLYRMDGSPKVSLPSSSPFKDVKKTDQFYKQIVWADQANITTGYADGTFRSTTKISREAIAAFLYRFEGRPSVSLPKSSPFKDVSKSDQFYKEIVWLDKAGITTGYSDGTFRSKTNTSREAIAAFLYRLSGSPAVSPPPASIPSSFTVSGSGWGHGVGMSAWGALGMAKEGSSATQILQHYFTGTKVQEAAANNDIRVEVFGSGSDNRNSVSVVVRSPGSDSTDDGQWRMRFYNWKDGAAELSTSWTGKNNEDLMVTRDGTKVIVTREDGTKATATKDVSLQWEATSYYQSTSPEDPYVELLDKEGGTRQTKGQYRHGKLLISVPDARSAYSRIIVSNELKLNTEYLYGLGEVPSSWPASTLQAFAIAARGFALNADKTYSATCNCNLYDDDRSQVFVGWSKENEGTNAYYGKKWVAAVDGTNNSTGSRGDILTYNGSIAKVYYFAHSGGQTENSEDIWGGVLPYMKSVDDHWSNDPSIVNNKWTYTLTQAKAKSVFGLSDVVSIKVTSRTAGGSDAAAKAVTATSSTGKTSTITGPESIRSKLAAGKSPWLWSFTAKY